MYTNFLGLTLIPIKLTIDKYIIVSCPFVCGYPFKLNESLFPKRSQIFFTWRSIMSCVQDLSILSGYRSLSNSKFIWLIWRSRSLKTENSFSFSLNLGGMSSWRNLADSSARRFISISVLGKLRSWRKRLLITFQTFRSSIKTERRKPPRIVCTKPERN